MKKNVREISSIECQIVAPPEGAGVILEFLDENDVAFMEVNVDSNGKRHLIVYDSSKWLSMPLSEMKKAIQIAEEKVVNMDPDSLFEE